MHLECYTSCSFVSRPNPLKSKKKSGPVKQVDFLELVHAISVT